MRKISDERKYAHAILLDIAASSVTVPLEVVLQDREKVSGFEGAIVKQLQEVRIQLTEAVLQYLSSTTNVDHTGAVHSSYSEKNSWIKLALEALEKDSIAEALHDMTPEKDLVSQSGLKEQRFVQANDSFEVYNIPALRLSEICHKRPEITKRSHNAKKILRNASIQVNIVTKDMPQFLRIEEVSQEPDSLVKFESSFSDVVSEEGHPDFEQNFDVQRNETFARLNDAFSNQQWISNLPAVTLVPSTSNFRNKERGTNTASSCAEAEQANTEHCFISVQDLSERTVLNFKPVKNSDYVNYYCGTPRPNQKKWNTVAAVPPDCISEEKEATDNPKVDKQNYQDFCHQNSNNISASLSSKSKHISIAHEQQPSLNNGSAANFENQNQNLFLVNSVSASLSLGEPLNAQSSNQNAAADFKGMKPTEYRTTETQYEIEDIQSALLMLLQEVQRRPVVHEASSTSAEISSITSCFECDKKRLTEQKQQHTVVVVASETQTSPKNCSDKHANTSLPLLVVVSNDGDSKTVVQHRDAFSQTAASVLELPVEETIKEMQMQGQLENGGRDSNIVATNSANAEVTNTFVKDSQFLKTSAKNSSILPSSDASVQTKHSFLSINHPLQTSDSSNSADYSWAGSVNDVLCGRLTEANNSSSSTGVASSLSLGEVRLSRLKEILPENVYNKLIESIQTVDLSELIEKQADADLPRINASPKIRPKKRPVVKGLDDTNSNV